MRTKKPSPCGAIGQLGVGILLVLAAALATDRSCHDQCMSFWRLPARTPGKPMITAPHPPAPSSMLQLLPARLEKNVMMSLIQERTSSPALAGSEKIQTRIKTTIIHPIIFAIKSFPLLRGERSPRPGHPAEATGLAYPRVPRADPGVKSN